MPPVLQAGPGKTPAGRAQGSWPLGLSAAPPRKEGFPPYPAEVPPVGPNPSTTAAPSTPLRSTPLRQQPCQGYSVVVLLSTRSTRAKRGRLLFWIRACRQKALYCACEAPSHVLSIYLVPPQPSPFFVLFNHHFELSLFGFVCGTDRVVNARMGILKIVQIGNFPLELIWELRVTYKHFNLEAFSFVINRHPCKIDGSPFFCL